MKKKLAHTPAANIKPDIHTSSDYEKLRHFMVEGGEMLNTTEHELAVFITYGAAAWIRLSRDGYDTEQIKWRKQNQVHGSLGNLAVLLANMMES